MAGPTQITWGGKTEACRPPADIQEKYKETLSHAHSPSHWSTFDTVKLLFLTLWSSYVKPTMERLGLNPATTKVRSLRSLVRFTLLPFFRFLSSLSIFCSHHVFLWVVDDAVGRLLVASQRRDSGLASCHLCQSHHLLRASQLHPYPRPS